MTVLITGGRGLVAQAVLRRCVEGGLDVRLGTRDPGKVTAPSGVAVTELDIARPETHQAALAGVESVFLYADPQGVDEFVRSCETAGVRRVSLLSTSSLTRSDADTNPIAQMHDAAENALLGSGIPATLLRPGTFATNTLQWAETIRQAKPLRFPYPEAHSSAIHEADIADVAFETLTNPAHEGHSYTMSGPESITQRQQLAAIAEATGSPIDFDEISEDEYRTRLQRWGVEFVDQLLQYLRDWDGRAATVVPTVQELTGHPARSYKQWALDHAADFMPAHS